MTSLCLLMVGPPSFLRGGYGSGALATLPLPSHTNRVTTGGHEPPPGSILRPQGSALIVPRSFMSPKGSRNNNVYN
jgi:hypothetical protein